MKSGGKGGKSWNKWGKVGVKWQKVGKSSENIFAKIDRDLPL